MAVHLLSRSANDGLIIGRHSRQLLKSYSWKGTAVAQLPQGMPLGWVTRLELQQGHEALRSLVHRAGDRLWIYSLHKIRIQLP
jgi:hypothetical protein